MKVAGGDVDSVHCPLHNTFLSNGMPATFEALWLWMLTLLASRPSEPTCYEENYSYFETQFYHLLVIEQNLHSF